MQNLQSKLIAGGAVVILAAIGTVMNRQAARAQGQGGPTVTIGAPIPLPVTGTLVLQFRSSLTYLLDRGWGIESGQKIC